MLFVDGMNGVVNNNRVIQWLYSLTTSKHHVIVKSSLKLLLVFAEYQESNSSLMIAAVNAVDSAAGKSFKIPSSLAALNGNLRKI
jgi:hypothetical protein